MVDEDDLQAQIAAAQQESADNAAFNQLNEVRLAREREAADQAAGQAGQARGSSETRIQNQYEKDWGYGNPDKDSANRYEDHFNRDHVLAKIPKEKLEIFIDILKAYDSLIMVFVSFKSKVGDEMAHMLAGEKLSIVDSLRAGDGFERTMQVTLASKLEKNITSRPVMASG